MDKNLFVIILEIIFDKRDDFTFPIVNFPFLCSNIPAAPAYGVYITANPLLQSV